MDTPDKRIARCLLTKTLTFIIVSLILFLFQLMLAGRDVAFQQAPMLVVISNHLLSPQLRERNGARLGNEGRGKARTKFLPRGKSGTFLSRSSYLADLWIGRPTQHFGFRHQPLSALHRECSYLYDVLHQNGAKH